MQFQNQIIFTHILKKYRFVEVPICEYPGYDTKLYPVVRLLFWSSRRGGDILYVVIIPRAIRTPRSSIR